MTKEMAIEMINEYLSEDNIDEKWRECLGTCKEALQTMLEREYSHALIEKTTKEYENERRTNTISKS